MKTIPSHLSLFRLLLILCCFVLTLPFLSPAATYDVYPGSSIQDAIDAADHGDEIIVHPGTYIENIDFKGKNLNLHSENPTDPSIVNTTIIMNGSASGSTVSFLGTESSDCVLSGFTITNGSAAFGAGISGSATQATIQYNHITNNTASNNGGGLYDCDGTIQYNTISHNSANYGAGLLICDGTIQYNIISYNSAAVDGGGLHACHGTIQHNTISRNTAVLFSGGLHGCNGTIQYNTIAENHATQGGGLFFCDGLILNNIILSNVGTEEGGGLALCDGLIAYNTIANNSGNHGGGLSQCANTIQNNTIVENRATQGGGLYDCDGTIERNSIFKNNASYGGGGLASCDGTIQNNTIWSNEASILNGGGLHQCNGTIQNNTIWDNFANEYGGGLHQCSGTIQNNIIWYNVAFSSVSQLDYCSVPSYCCIESWYGGGTGNIIDNPNMVDPHNADFHLASDSPCIDAGGSVSLTEDFEAESRPHDGTPASRGDGSDFDIGADEYHPPSSTPAPTPTAQFDFEGNTDGWTFRTIPPTPLHISHWADASSLLPGSALGINTPYDESTNYFALWDSLDTTPIPYSPDSLYQADWALATNRGTTDAVPSLRLRIGLTNQKAFAYCRAYPGDWLPLAQTPGSTTYRLFFEPPIVAPGLFLAFSAIDWAGDFRGTMPAGEIYLEEVNVYRHQLASFTHWMPVSWDNYFSPWTSAAAPPYTEPTFTQQADRLSLSSGVGADQVFGSWDSPSSRFAIYPTDLYRLGCFLTSNPQLGGPDLRLRVHTDDFRYAWYTYYASSYTPGESALPAQLGQFYYLYLMLPDGTAQECRFSFDLIDFSSSFGGTLSLYQLSLDSHRL